MMPVADASPDPLANYSPPGPDATAGESERRLALVWATLAARRDPAAGARRVTVLPPLVIRMSN
jgi:hypothetical protein